MTAPLATDPLLTLERLALWAQENPLSNPEFAGLIIEAVSVLLRRVGNPLWDLATIPPRARDIGYIVAKDYYLNPTQIRQESVGPLQETRDNKVLTGVAFTPTQEEEIRAIAAEETGGKATLWTLGFTRGPLETGQHDYTSDYLLWDGNGAWPIAYLTEEDAVVFDDGTTTTTA